MIDDLNETIELYKDFVECETKTAMVLRNVGNENSARDYEESAENNKKIVALLTELQERREADRWNFIHSEEDLPKEDGFYLVTIKYVESSSGKLKQNTSELYFSTGFQRWTDCGEEFDEDGVIAWKPMPEPCGESEVNDYDQNT